MKRREFIKNTGALLAAAPFMNFGFGKFSTEKMIVLGFDGMDPGIVLSMIKRGELPNIRKFLHTGTFTKMMSTAPAESPCAWSSFATGKDPGGHGIFGFIHKKPGTYFPGFNMTTATESKRFLKFGSWKIPLDSGKIELNRKGKPFWDYLQERGVESTIFKIPANYPPSEMKLGRAISGLGTPDIYGANGVFTIYTNDEDEAMKEDPKGKYKYAYFDDNDTMSEDCYIEGPANVFKREPESTKVPFRVYFDKRHRSIRIDIQGKEILLAEGKLSEWVEIKFVLIPNVKSVKAIVRFYLLDAGDKFRLFISAPCISPGDPAQPISSPENYSRELADKIGPFHTLGLPADFNAIRTEVFSMENYIVQSESVFKESKILFEYEFERFLETKKGMLFYYFSSIDQGSHIYWALRDPLHPFHNPEETRRFGDMIESLYRDFDKIVGDVLKRLPSKVPLIVLSDHGFAPLRRNVNLNTLLHENGFLKFSTEIDYSDSTFIPIYANWEKTKAFSMGLNGIYLNMKGREPEGSVESADKRKVMEGIKKMLLSVKDEKTGEHPVGKVFITEDNYARDYLEMGPDMIIGFNRNYALDSGSALGGIGKNALTDNLKRWTGDHIIDPHQVPAILLANFKISSKKIPHLWDMAPTILKMFGINPPPEIRGKSLV